MPRFEVFIPAADENSFNVTFRVDANNWMAALKTGMTKLGEQGANVQNILVDIQDDNSVHVTESASGRVFRIRELSDAEVAQAQVKKPATLPPQPSPVAPPAREQSKTLVGMPSFAEQQELEQLRAKAKAPELPPEPRTPIEEAPRGAAETTIPGGPALKEPVTAPEPRPQPKPEPALTAVPSHAAVTERPHKAASGAHAAPPAPVPAPVSVAPVASFPSTPPLTPAAPSNAAFHSDAAGVLEMNAAVARASTSPKSGMHPAHKRKSLHAEAEQVVELEAPTKPVVGQIGRTRSKTQKDEIEDMLAEVFERVQDVYNRKSADDALYFLLDLALEKIPAESGTIFDADAGTGDLTFRAVRGPKAKELLDAKMKIPAGTGVVGFCEVEGVALALSDVQKDPRYYSGVAEKVNYTPKSILCAPMMTHGRAFGCLQILNRKDGSKFNEVEVGLASYIAHQAALYLNSR